MMEILFYGLWFYGISFLGIIAIIVVDYKTAKYPMVFDYITILGLGLVPVLNTYIVIETIIMYFYSLWLYRSKFKTKDTETTDNPPYVFDTDSASMYPHGGATCK